jgi:tetratricopeptide (TPR) repeat protein
MRQLNPIDWRSVGQPVLVALVSVLVVFCSCEFAAAATDLQKVYVQNRRKPSFTQVVLFFKGQRPIRHGVSPSGEEYVIEFRHLTTIVKLDQVVLEAASTVGAITITSEPDKGSLLYLRYRQPQSTVKTMFLPATPPRPGFYRLALNVFPPISPQPPTSAPAPAPVPTVSAPGPPAAGSAVTASPPPPEVPSPPPLTLDEQPSVTYDIQTSKAEEGVRSGFSEALQQANRAYDRGDYHQAYELYHQFLNTSPAQKDELTAARYGLADSFFALNEAHLDDKAMEIFANYSVALKDGPTALSAPWAMFRCGLALMTAGAPAKARTYFEEVVTQFPKHPAAPSAMLALAPLYIEEKAFPEAIKVLRKALTYPLDTSVKVETYRRLGEAFYSAGEHAAAIEAFNAAVKADPELVFKEPVVLRYLGEAMFVEQKYDESRDKMFRYLNLRPDAPDRDLVLARIAEILTLQDEKDLAGKLYAYIQNTYPNSEGDVIAKIRRAEYLEGKDKITVDEATAIYSDLLQKPLAPPLSRLVHFKYALRLFERGNFSECIRILDESLKDNPSKAPMDDFTALRSKAVFGWCKQAYQQKDYAQVVQLHTTNTKLFAVTNSTEIDTMIADSYGRLRLYPNAIWLTQDLIKRQGTPKDEGLVLKAASYFLLSGDYRSAMQWCTQVQAPNLQTEKNLLLAQILFAQAQYPQVIELLNRLPDKDNTPAVSPVKWYGLYAESYMQVGNCTKAAPWFDKAIEVLGKDPDRSEERLRLLMNQGICYTKTGNTEKAVASLEAAVLLAPSEDLQCQLRYEMAKVYAEDGQVQKATEVLTKLLDSSLSLWKAAAMQELDYLKLRQGESARR